MKHTFFRSLLLALLLCLMMIPCAAAEKEEVFGYGELQLYSEGAFPAPPAQRQATFAARAKNVHQAIIEGLMAQESRINIYEYGITLADLQIILQDIINNEPDLFFVASTYRYSSYSGESTILALVPEYLYTGAELESEIAAYNSAVNAIVSDARKADTIVGQMLRANEYFCLNFEYDNSLTVRKPNEFFKQKKGVCQAYTLAYKAVLDRLGVTSTTAVSAQMNHIWNMAYVGGAWYHVDVTWNDPTPDTKLFAHHKNFLRSDSGISNTGHYGWVANYKATSTKYDSVGWLNLGVPVSVIEDKVYYATIDNFNVTIHCCDLSDLSVEDLYSFSVNSYSSWGVPCCTNGYRVYFPKGGDVYSVDMEGGDYRLEYTSGVSGGSIRSMIVRGDKLSLYLTNGSSASILTVNVEFPMTMTIVSPQMNLQPGQRTLLKVDIQPEPEETPTLTVTISQPPVLSIDGDGVLTAGVPGQTILTVSYQDKASASAVVTVHRKDAAILPAGTKDIKREAFAGMPTIEFILPEGAERIETGAFAGCNDLLYINLPGSLTYISPDAFNEESGVTLIVTNGTYAYEYAQASGLNVAVLNPEATETPAPEATENGDTVTE